MGTPAIGEVVLISFPFSDLSASKLRPALVLAFAGRDEWICLQITSKPYADANPIELTDGDFAGGSLQRTSYLRPGKRYCQVNKLGISPDARPKHPRNTKHLRCIRKILFA